MMTILPEENSIDSCPTYTSRSCFAKSIYNSTAIPDLEFISISFTYIINQFAQSASYIYNMCGIAGIISSNQNIIHPSLLHRMSTALAHRGPDGEAFWINDSNKVGLAHRRLAIIDTSEAAADD